jgi:hypothetical protein
MTQAEFYGRALSISDMAIASPANGGTATESDKSNQDRYDRLCAEPLAVK